MLHKFYIELVCICNITQDLNILVTENALKTLNSGARIFLKIVNNVSVMCEIEKCFWHRLGVPHLSSQTRIRVLRGAVMGARTVLFVMPEEHPDPKKTADTLATITGGRVIILAIRPYIPQPSDSDGGKK